MTTQNVRDLIAKAEENLARLDARGVERAEVYAELAKAAALSELAQVIKSQRFS